MMRRCSEGLGAQGLAQSSRRVVCPSAAPCDTRVECHRLTTPLLPISQHAPQASPAHIHLSPSDASSSLASLSAYAYLESRSATHPCCARPPRRRTPRPKIWRATRQTSATRQATPLRWSHPVCARTAACAAGPCSSLEAGRPSASGCPTHGRAMRHIPIRPHATGARGYASRVAWCVQRGSSRTVEN